MKGLRFHKFGDFRDLQLKEVPEAPLAPDEVRVRIMAASVNPSDVRNIEGKMEGATLPRIPGRDFAGIAVEGPVYTYRAFTFGERVATSDSLGMAVTPSAS